MKNNLFKILGVLAICGLCSIEANADSTIKYYGSKAGLFRPCKGHLISICKEVHVEDPEKVDPQFLLDPDDKQINNEKSINYNQYIQNDNELIIRYDGIDYIIPEEAFNWKDGSIDINKL